ncbi:hypothetical protein CAOG_007627 [Capsaspora owczarzaki ATCC 30864]|uniref:RING-CH-type domain-containing protein n=2 Tax=Capsaspora owczarzaki (strain ATCC 30864) TaxID=595528 RepID=A0A0D2X547_CAPO3|nr:hypothetical protein CAOG_007627 [Capsaspora owczarzaki ATCC 30864]
MTTVAGDGAAAAAAAAAADASASTTQPRFAQPSLHPHMPCHRPTTTSTTTAPATTTATTTAMMIEHSQAAAAAAATGSSSTTGNEGTESVDMQRLTPAVSPAASCCTSQPHPSPISPHPNNNNHQHHHQHLQHLQQQQHTAVSIAERPPAADADNVSCASAVTCRICKLTEDESELPLIQPCLCKGSVGFVHAECLRVWFGMANCSARITPPEQQQEQEPEHEDDDDDRSATSHAAAAAAAANATPSTSSSASTSTYVSPSQSTEQLHRVSDHHVTVVIESAAGTPAPLPNNSHFGSDSDSASVDSDFSSDSSLDLPDAVVWDLDEEEEEIDPLVLLQSQEFRCEICHFRFGLEFHQRKFKQWDKLKFTKGEKRQLKANVACYALAGLTIGWTTNTFLLPLISDAAEGFNYYFMALLLIVSWIIWLTLFIVHLRFYIRVYRRWKLANRDMHVLSYEEAIRSREAPADDSTACPSMNPTGDSCKKMRRASRVSCSPSEGAGVASSSSSSATPYTAECDSSVIPMRVLGQ